MATLGDTYEPATCSHCQQQYNKIAYAADVLNNTIVSYKPHCFRCISCGTWKDGKEIGGYAVADGPYCTECESVEHLNTRLS